MTTVTGIQPGNFRPVPVPLTPPPPPTWLRDVEEEEEITLEENTPTTIDAVQALRARGVDTAEDLLEHATPEQILTACRRWDGRKGVGPGLLASWIRNGVEPEPPAAPPTIDRLRDEFDEYAARYPVGTIIQSPHWRSVPVENPPPHSRIWGRIRQEDCPGTVRIIAANYPALIAECDSCRYDCNAIPIGTH